MDKKDGKTCQISVEPAVVKLSQWETRSLVSLHTNGVTSHWDNQALINLGLMIKRPKKLGKGHENVKAKWWQKLARACINKDHSLAGSALNQLNKLYIREKETEIVLTSMGRKLAQGSTIYIPKSRDGVIHGVKISSKKAL